MTNQERVEYMLKRKEKKITLTEIAGEIGVSVAWLSLLESGLGNPSPEVAGAYMRYIDQTPSRRKIGRLD
ncbi:hypothetical protein SD70_26055 [Gordoniibacillus kamchatkensis]|uniref:HTH cro/C1-type domain-containing protein n=1 Tax=Gordoniibacillus kamchatkensis TaxID=1590651 RepID=A0ABR5ADM3_9BACL|nr:helix-turn-helix transcriptional regulator [Paenibacillus sp. VKM B-2647]KIL38502.1 hypothetical protein SD70_26055 [Paenibacillus sp. VKM B-2647]